MARPKGSKNKLKTQAAEAADPTQPQVFAYDLHITPSAGVETLRAYGNFTLNPGVSY